MKIQFRAVWSAKRNDGATIDGTETDTDFYGVVRQAHRKLAQHPTFVPRYINIRNERGEQVHLTLGSY